MCECGLFVRSYEAFFFPRTSSRALAPVVAEEGDQLFPAGGQRLPMGGQA